MAAPPDITAPDTTHNAPWLFGLLVLPYGFTNAVTVLLTPYLLRKYEMPVDQIAGIVAVALLPSIWAFLWSPLADTGLRRRSWAVISAIGSGLAMGAAIISVHGSPAIFTALLFLSNAFAGLLSSCCGALLTAMPESMRGRCGAWYQAGNIGGGTIGGGVTIWLADHITLPVLAFTIGVTVVLPALTALFISEPAPPGGSLRPKIAGMFRDMRDVLSARRTWLGMIFFLSPVGAAAVGNLISGVGQDYRASGDEVALVTGVAGGLLSALGCFIGGILADRIPRMYAYAIAGALAAIPAIYLAVAPHNAFTFGAGYSAYAVSSGLAYAIYTALVLDVVGRRRHAAAMAYATLNATGNMPISYMTWLDGIGYKHWGTSGLMWTDAVANGGFAIVLLIVAMCAGHHWHHTRNEAAPPAVAG